MKSNLDMAHYTPSFHTSPQLWKSYAYTRNMRVQQLSPFEADVLGPLFRDIGSKFKHKVEVRSGDALQVVAGRPDRSRCPVFFGRAPATPRASTR